MGWLQRFLVVVLWLFGLASGCAEFPSASAAGGVDGTGGGGGSGVKPRAADPEPQTKTMSTVCAVNVTETWASVPWELSVDPGPIEAGGLFSVSLDGVAVFEDDFADAGNAIIAGGVREINLLDMQVSIAAHTGATGPVAVLTNELIPYQCTLEDSPGTRPSCDPANNLPSIPGWVGNTDCQPVGDFNPCSRFIAIPTSDDCDVGGTCWNLGRLEPGALCDEQDFCKAVKKGQCADNGFCIAGDVRVPLRMAVEQYVADSSGDVRFGWHVDRDSPWDAPLPVFGDPLGPSGFRLRVASLAVAFGCVLGELDPDGWVGPMPDSKLIAFPIGDAGCLDGTGVCPPGFAAANDGLCRFSAEDSPTSVRDPLGSASVCEDLPFVKSLWSYLPISDPSVLESPSLVVRAEVTAEDVDDDACLHNAEIVAHVYSLDAQSRIVTNNWVVFNQKTSTTVSTSDPSIRGAEIRLETDFLWSSSPDVCCERTFQTTWTATVAQCEGW